MIHDNLTLLKTCKKNMKKIKKDSGHSKLSKRKTIYKKRFTHWIFHKHRLSYFSLITLHDLFPPG